MARVYSISFRYARCAHRLKSIGVLNIFSPQAGVLSGDETRKLFEYAKENNVRPDDVTAALQLVLTLLLWVVRYPGEQRLVDYLRGTHLS